MSAQQKTSPFRQPAGTPTAETLTGEFARKQRADIAAKLDVEGLTPAQKILCTLLAAPVREPATEDAFFPATKGLEVVVGDDAQQSTMEAGIRQAITAIGAPDAHPFDYSNQPLPALFAAGDGKAPDSGAFKRAWENGGTLLLINADGDRINPQMVQLVRGEIQHVTFHSTSEGPISLLQDMRHPDFRVIAFCKDFDYWPGAIVNRVHPDNVHRVELADQNTQVQQALSERTARRTKAIKALRRHKP